MNKFDIAGLLTTYAEKAAKARSTEHLKQIIRELKGELDLRKVGADNE